MPLILLSHLINTPIVDKSGKKIATLKDFTVCLSSAGGKGQSPQPHPHLSGLVAVTATQRWWVPLEQVQAFEEKVIELAINATELTAFERREGEALLAEDILDKALVDIPGRRLVRANDLVLSIVGKQPVIWLMAVDVSLQARLLRFIPFIFKKDGILALDDEMLDWSEVEYLATNAPQTRLDIQHEHLAGLSVAYLVPLLEELSYQQAVEVVEDLRPEVAASVLENMRPDCARGILDQLKASARAEILIKMNPLIAERLAGNPDQLF
jgi:sporulation protein YlmC with PRC-barrel domain